jgi:DUF1365 family protein
MKTANVISAGPEEHPESGADLMRILVNRPWAVAGERWPATELWAQRDMPEPVTGEAIEWDHRHVWLRGVRYEKPEDDRNPSASLH